MDTYGTRTDVKLVSVTQTNVGSCYYQHQLEYRDLMLLFNSCSHICYFRPSAEFIYRLGRLKPRASKFRGPPSRSIMVLAVISLSCICCHYALYSQNNPSAILFEQLRSISQYYRMLNTRHHQPSFKSIKHSSILL